MIKLLIFLNKVSESVKKLVATTIDQIYDASVDTDTANQSLTLRVSLNNAHLVMPQPSMPLDKNDGVLALKFYVWIVITCKC